MRFTIDRGLEGGCKNFLAGQFSTAGSYANVASSTGAIVSNGMTNLKPSSLAKAMISEAIVCREHVLNAK